MRYLLLASLLFAPACGGDDDDDDDDDDVVVIDAATSAIDAAGNAPDAPPSATDATGPDATPPDGALPDAAPSATDATGPDATPPDGALPDAAPMCGTIGKSCTVSGKCDSGQECMFSLGGDFCVKTRAGCGGFAGATCDDPNAPLCYFLPSADFGPCSSAFERDCICDRSPASIEGCP